jgi:hypothetical protein
VPKRLKLAPVLKKPAAAPGQLLFLVNAGQEALLFAGEVAVLMRGRFSRKAPAGLAWV